MQRFLRTTFPAALLFVTLSACVFSGQKNAQPAPVSATSRVFSSVGSSADGPGKFSATRDSSNLIYIVPIEGMPTSAGLVLADAIAATLRDASKPAVLSPLKNEMGPSVSGRIMVAEERGSVVWITALWELYAPYGTAVAEYRQQIVVDKGLWRQGSAEAINLLVTDAGPQITKMVHDYVSPIAMTENRPIADPLPGSPTPSPTPLPGVSAALPALPSVLTPEGGIQAPPGKPTIKAGSEVIATLGHRKKPLSVSPKAEKRTALITPEKVTPEKVKPVKPPEKTARKTPILRPVPEAPQPARPLTPLDHRLALKTPKSKNRPAAKKKDAKTRKRILMPVPESARGPDYTNPPPVTWDRPSFLIKLVEGAPGDGNAALTKAMKAALRKRDITVTEDPRQAGYVIRGKVEISAPVGGRQQARIVWSVNTMGGDEVGKAVQENAVKAGSLDGTWGRVADIVSAAAVSGIRELFGVEEKKSSSRSKGPKFIAGPPLPHVPGRAVPPP